MNEFRLLSFSMGYNRTYVELKQLKLNHIILSTHVIIALM